ncbi:hypothetical protein [Anaeromyxobacter dehalogenans]|uniref:DUF885 domain-containing protein n=1 Tax=Anaeromyxobacter dehalogenans (strain 2CP-C) TaxID=290397 RepID=Q2IK58_ANADE|nr:hypothetical protein [Anaeromyxobacter dehalogenans]ABC82041.1 hypothetical protein Adeh_2271 [Anaeromyxobacter dehalogenans 2CP-C]
MSDEATLASTAATAILGIDTLWGGDVMSASGTGRYIADSWFSDEPLPPAYTLPAAARLRETGGVAAPSPDRAAIDAYLSAVDVPGAIDALAALGRGAGGVRGAYLAAQGESLRVMWALAEELLGRGPKVPYERCVIASTGKAPEASRPEAKRERLAQLLGVRADAEALLAAADAWRGERLVPRKAIKLLADACIAQLDEGARRHVVPHLPASLHGIPRANIEFLPIENAWFSGSMNYLGRARRPDGSPRYEATYEINAALQISVPEFLDLVAHEVVPGHVTNFALAQALHVQGRLGFEGTVLTMNTRGAALSEGLANNAMMMALGVTEVEQLPDPDLQIGKLLVLLQDDAKNQASWLTWAEGRPQDEVAAVLRRDYLLSDERAAKIGGAWARHPLNGRMYLPCYRAGTEKVAELRRRHPPEQVIPALYQVHGLVDVVTIDQVL